MTAPARLAGFAAVVAAAFGGAAIVGAAVGPEPRCGGHGTPARVLTNRPAGGAEAASHPVRGLSVAEGGLRLVVDDAELRRGRRAQLRFDVVDEAGATVRDFEVAHEKRMHLIVARRDLTGFQHLHPEQRATARGRSDVLLADAGSYRALRGLHARRASRFTLATDLRVDGAADLHDLPAPRAAADAGDGYEVRRGGAQPTAGDRC